MVDVKILKKIERWRATTKPQMKKSEPEQNNPTKDKRNQEKIHTLLLAPWET